MPFSRSASLVASLTLLLAASCNRTTDVPSPELRTPTSAQLALTQSDPQPASGTPPPVDMKQEGPMALVELFTSQGCSSCPPADENLAELAARADEGGERIFPLSFHVDYWNYLGWSDPFSSAEYSERQRAYSRAWNARRVYTPQMVVNGHSEFVGSNDTHLDRALRLALKTPTEATVKVRATPQGDRKLEVGYTVQADGGVRLNLAAVQRRAESDVDRGENSGRKLVHRNVVRRFQVVEKAQNGTWNVALPDDVAMSEVMVVAYAQRADWVIVGAASAMPHPTQR